MATKKIKEATYHTKGMHCSSCEVLIEKKLLELDGVRSVEASVGKERVIIEYENKKPATQDLTKLFKNEGYNFSDSPAEEINSTKNNSSYKLKELIPIFSIGLLIIAGFVGLNKLGLSELINVDSKSSLPMFFIFGLIAGVSSCAALVGGIILSMSKQWDQLYSIDDSTWKKIQPHLIFNLGRLISYGFFGMVLGTIGSKLNLSLSFGSILVIAVSVMMIFLALQMFGIKSFQKFQITLPRFITRFAADESHFKGRYMPFLMGAFTFLLPCGFTLTAQGLALVSGSAIQGGLIMFLFALGTLPMLLGIGISSVKFCQKANLSKKFMQVAATLVLFFALYNINAQLNVLGFFSANDLKINSSTNTNIESKNTTPTKENANKSSELINGKQVIKMNASASGYSPNNFKVKVGIPVRWEITDKGTSGCTNAVISKSLFDGEIALTLGETSIKEFTPQKVGKYKFSCWMGMVSGTIEVIN